MNQRVKNDGLNWVGGGLKGKLGWLANWRSNKDCLVGKSIPGLFKFERLVGEGGFGRVYRAINLSTSLWQPKVLAVKVFPEQGNNEFVKKEFELQRRAEHPNIPTIVDAGENKIPPRGQKRHWISMEFVEGQTLESYMQEDEEGRKLWGKPRLLLDFLTPIFDAVEHIHTYQETERSKGAVADQGTPQQYIKGIVHGDIKPGNILIGTIPSRNQGEHLSKPQPWLVDFGVAKPLRALNKGRTVSTQRGFDWRWAAPEHITAYERTPATDVHALGLIMTWGLTGHRPYEGDDEDFIASEVQNEKRPTPKKKGFDFGPWEAIIAQALALKPADRFQTAGAFRDALKAALADEEMRAVIERSEKDKVQPNLADTDAGHDVAATTKIADKPPLQALNNNRASWLVGLPLGILSVGVMAS